MASTAASTKERPAPESAGRCQDSSKEPDTDGERPLRGAAQPSETVLETAGIRDFQFLTEF